MEEPSIAPHHLSPMVGQARRGFLEVCNLPFRLKGWAVDLDRPSSPALLELRIGGKVCGQFVADVQRPDIAALQPEAAQCGFDVDLSTLILMLPGNEVARTPVEVGFASGGPTLALDNAAPALNEAALLARSGCFDAAHYLAQNPDVMTAGVEPLLHYLAFGEAEGRTPNPLFDPAFYAAQIGDTPRASVSLLVDYLLRGEAAGSAPSLLFDPGWYRTRYGLASGDSALAHYLTKRGSVVLSPSADFDAQHYLDRYPDVASAGAEPLTHYLNHGAREGRNPSPHFDTRFYARRYLNGRNEPHPFLHWLANRANPGIVGRMPDHEPTAYRETRRFTQPGRDFEPVRPLAPGATRLARLFAYFLPQFHAFPENDRWWGAGFTEWTNLPRGVARFKDHFQPRVPRDLGHYDLANPATLRRLAAMARGAGIEGFIFYFYWFDGRRLMHKPVDDFLADRSVEMPFALLWANENWTRRWDGSEDEVLVAQHWRPEDELPLLDEFARHFRDPRYLRIDGRPLLIIYRPGLIPDTAATIRRWRQLLAERHGEEPMLLMVQAFGDTDPAPFGFDGAVEFPPHKFRDQLPSINHTLDLIDHDFSAEVVAYADLVAASLAEPAPSYPLIRTAMPSWDNDARRQGAGLVVHGATPSAYEAWLRALVSQAQASPFHGQPMVFVNAWNEWAEGAYLEPDLHFGAAFLNATARAVTGEISTPQARPTLLLVGHDAHPYGAQLLLLHLGRTLRRCFGIGVEFLLQQGGPLADAYAEVAPTHLLGAGREARLVMREAFDRGIRVALVNTSAAAALVPAARDAGLAPTLLVHELPRLLRAMNIDPSTIASAAAAAETVIFPATRVRDAFPGWQAARSRLLPQGIYRWPNTDRAARAELRERLGIPPEAPLVVGIGLGDLRKGFDLFINLWRHLQRPGMASVHACWVGRIDETLGEWLKTDLEAAQASATFHLAGPQDDVSPFLAAADAMALTSREDPFPSAALEALAAGLPVAAFEGTGGIPDLLQAESLGPVVPATDVPAMAAALNAWLDRPGAARQAAAAERTALMRAKFDWKSYAFEVAASAMGGIADLSVLVRPDGTGTPSQAERLRRMLDLALPVRELLLVADPAESEALVALAATSGRDVTVLGADTDLANAATFARGTFLLVADGPGTADLTAPERLLAELAAAPERASASDGQGSSLVLWRRSTLLLDLFRETGQVPMMQEPIVSRGVV